MSASFHRKPTAKTIEAVQWDGTSESFAAIFNLTGRLAEWHGLGIRIVAGVNGAQGWVDVPVGHWVVKAAANDFYPVEAAYFAKHFGEGPAVDYEAEVEALQRVVRVLAPSCDGSAAIAFDLLEVLARALDGAE